MVSTHYKSGDIVTVRCLGDQTFQGVHIVVVDTQGNHGERQIRPLFLREFQQRHLDKERGADMNLHPKGQFRILEIMGIEEEWLAARKRGTR